MYLPQKNWLRSVKNVSAIAFAAYMVFFSAYIPAALALDQYLPHSSLPAQIEQSNDIPTLIETCPPPPGEAGNHPYASNPTVEIGETFIINDYIIISAPSFGLDVVTVEPESLVEAVDTHSNQYRALLPGKVTMTVSYSGQYQCSPDDENIITVSFSGSIQMNVTVSGTTIYLPFIQN